MSFVHRLIGFAVVGGFLLLFLWGAWAFLRKRPPGAWFWRLIAALQVTLVLQLIVGLILLAMGRSQPLLHYLYGAVFPGIVLVVAHVLARGLDDTADAFKVFAAGAFIAFGLTLRALATGLGIG